MVCPRDFCAIFAKHGVRRVKTWSISETEAAGCHRLWWSVRKPPSAGVSTRHYVARRARQHAAAPMALWTRYATGPAVGGRNPPNALPDRAVRARATRTVRSGEHLSIHAIMKHRQHDDLPNRHWTRPFVRRGASKRPRIKAPAAAVLRYRRRFRARGPLEARYASSHDV
jgi:hypothetical protein